MLHSLLARHVENILDEARDFDKDALAREAEQLLKTRGQPLRGSARTLAAEKPFP